MIKFELTPLEEINPFYEKEELETTSPLFVNGDGLIDGGYTATFTPMVPNITLNDSNGDELFHVSEDEVRYEGAVRYDSEENCLMCYIGGEWSKLNL